MRSLLIAALAVSTMTTPDAEACGSYIPEPHIMRVTSHGIPGAGGGWSTRAFVVLDEPAPAGLTWRRIAPHSYDWTEIADAPDLDAPMQVTLVGASGVRVASSKRRVYLRQSWQFEGTVTALEVAAPRDLQLTIAIAGRHAGASWIELDGASSPGEAAWVRANGVTPLTDDSIYVERLHGTDLETVSVQPRDGTMVTFVRQNGQSLGRYDGSPLGAFTSRGQRRLLLSAGRGALQTIWI